MSTHPESILTEMHARGSIHRRSFSLCLAWNGGTLSLGGYRSIDHVEAMRFTDLVNDKGMYAVRVREVRVGEEPLADAARFFNAGRGAIVDSGTTDTYFPGMLQHAFLVAWRNITGKSYSNAKQFFSYQEFRALPTITIVLMGGCEWVLQPEYFFEPSRENGEVIRTDVKWTGTRQFTSRVYLDEPKGAVLGANAMMGHDILFDVEQNRIGIARSICVFNPDTA